MTDEAKRCVEALRFKEDFECVECPIPAGNCEENCLFDVAADLIESIAAELEQVKRERDALRLEIISYKREIHAIANACDAARRERDAAVEELRGVCRACIYYNDNEMPFCCYFEDCTNGLDDWDSEDYWQWHGVKED